MNFAMNKLCMMIKDGENIRFSVLADIYHI
jgi:hypothetical protein